MTTNSGASSSSAVPSQRVPVPVQILSILLYGGFAISVSIVAMALFGLIGVFLAVLFAWQWGRIPTLGGRMSVDDAVDLLRPEVERSAPRSSGNQSFDSYRDQLLNRLEKEQTEFEGFLSRLRAAKDTFEFDRFMDDRAMSRGHEQSRPAAALVPHSG